MDIIYIFNAPSKNMNRAKNKVRNYIFAILLLSIYSIVCKAQNSFVKSRATFSVSRHLKKTHLKINAGDVVQVTASGQMVLHGVPGSAGPDGIDGFTDRCMDSVFPYGALLYKIGNDDWVMPDPDNPLTADQAGYLKLMVNDNDPSNNRGRFTVKVTVTSSKSNSRNQIVNGSAPEKAKDTMASIPHSTAVPEKAKNKIRPIPHSAAVPRKAKDNIAATPHSAATPAKAKENLAPSPHSTAGLLTLSELQQLSSNGANVAKAFLISRHFQVDAESTVLTNKYNFNNNDVNATIIKYVKENQASFSTSSAYNYEAIKTSLLGYGYTPRELVTKAEGVTKYANSRYTMSIVLFKLNNKPQYLFVVKKL